ncbi:flagellar basal body P-ring formation chaperone FlgA [Campylobacter canadensis]|uniref:Flagella basal body P-ring formation protein FlgA n=1 Tax=Campylobacter canadensis TaxID=449520 RepID=A0ABS7WQG5_9BACT|nr:flagellar basal body P-ring formation chaperone FlgA [Campylobacter canadensis]MBZ7987002.1 flagellar basal body P-ring formation protein FlgA [Campylobacter canadensis]MBZ7995278.1 flagellar basal body P-ring formation protein FlgA [Campylobacter canadensis]MBZ7997180.1 flagellar basal body P-ring formation protein FlgA [Campylobacter canadensis]MBZ7998038.1 flagellar basal body P-ring formation protein FlgA [Campylobacter canadensis]MBZ8000693.1 flagellar basal body P-ring formation prote
MKIIYSILALCLSLNAASLKEQLAKSFLAQKINLNIVSIQIKPENDDNCILSSAVKLNTQGIFRAICNNQNKQFSYTLNATSKVLILKRNIAKDEAISLSDVLQKNIAFKQAPNDALSMLDENSYAKSFLKANTILTQNKLKPNYVINKEDSVVGIIDDGNLSVFIDLTALQNGVKGQRIRLKNSDGKVIYGEILNNKQVLIR